ncbi:hypothetical protein CLV43_101217 [Umezawaea tangerina]|uniref:Flagellar basal body-associated protein FliL n=2 Tax=Umezawaea tangerina TaxID=84725 RepID=A0A2T0TJR0_9PSEU|nr:hypothetical protein CLV43_101217 [Umezawaea tangerina]
MRWQASQPSDPEQTGIIRTNQFSDPEQTQKVRPVGFPTGPQQFGPQQTPPPWGEQSPPRGMPGMHGPEVFDSGSGKSPKVAVYVLIGVLAFVVIGGGVFWFGLNGGMGDTTTAASSTAASSSATPPGPPANLAAVPEPPGKANAKNGEYTLAKAKDAKILSDKDVKALEAAGVDKIYDKSSTDSGLAYAVAVYVAKDADSAKKLSSTLVDNQVAAGMSTVEQIDVPESVSLMKLAVSDQFMYRGIYTSGPVTVRVATAGPSTIPDQDVAKKFNEFVQKVLGTVRVG